MMRWIPLIVSGAMFCCAEFPAAAAEDDRAQIISLENRLIDSFKVRNLDGVMDCYLPDERLFVFDVVPPRQYVGAQAYRKSWQALLDAFPGPVDADIEDLHIEIDGLTAFSHFAVHYIVTAPDGQRADLTARLTEIYRKTDGRWLIVHEHVSMPVELPSGKADVHSKL